MLDATVYPAQEDIWKKSVSGNFFFYFLIFFLKCFVKQTWIMKSFLGMLHNVMLMLGMERGEEKPVVHVCLYLEIKKKMKYMES